MTPKHAPTSASVFTNVIVIDTPRARARWIAEGDGEKFAVSGNSASPEIQFDGPLVFVMAKRIREIERLRAAAAARLAHREQTLNSRLYGENALRLIASQGCRHR